MLEKLLVGDGKKHYNKGIEWYISGEYDTARKELEKAIHTDDLNADEKFNALLVGGDCLLKLGNYLQAIKALNEASKFKRISQNNKTNFQQNWLLAKAYEKISDYSRTIECCESAITEYHTDLMRDKVADDRFNAYAKLRKGIADVWLNYYDDAINNLCDAIELVQKSGDNSSDISNPNMFFAVSLLHMGIVCEKRLHHEEAIQLIKGAIELVPNSDPIPYMPHPNTFHAYALYYLGLAYRRVNREESACYFEQGLQYLNNAIELALESNSYLFYQLSRQKGWTLIYLNRYDDAERALKNAFGHSINAKINAKIRAEAEEKDLINKFLIKLPYLKDDLDAEELICNKKYYDAIEIHDKILKELDSNPDQVNHLYKDFRTKILWDKSICLISIRKYDDAIKIYENILEELDSNPDKVNHRYNDFRTKILWENGNCLMSLQKYNDAINVFENILTELNSNPDLLNILDKDFLVGTLWNKGACLISIHKYDDVLENFDKIIKILDSNPEIMDVLDKDFRAKILWSQANCLRDLKRYGDAVKIYNDILGELYSNQEIMNCFGKDKCAWVLWDKAICLNELQENNGAIEICNNILEELDSNPGMLNRFRKEKNTRIMWYQGDRLYDLQKFNGDIQIYDNLLKDLDSNPNIMNLIGKYFYAITLWEKGCDCLMGLRKFDDAIYVFDKLLNELDSNPNVMNVLDKDFRVGTLWVKGECLLSIQKYDDVLENFDKILELLDSNPEIMDVLDDNYRVNILMAKGLILVVFCKKYDAAIKVFKEAIKLNPNDPAPYSEVADCYYELNKPSQAELFIGEHYIALGEYEKAIEPLRKAIEAWNPNEDYDLAYLESRLKFAKEKLGDNTVDETEKPVCPDCGAELKSGDSFCRKCGRKLKDD
ncbi:tetratricopeptide repeat protein [Methanomicrobium mobile]|uniref:tetratricopeptide repeat protein n=1 Tax=Methanomicrobium mobile TaxID=2205 RepID=UPI0005B2AAF9|nr:tetratricopeptide repeat protein [Methanomicrobium mobile]